MYKRVKYCEKCNKGLYYTSHYCIPCLYKLSKIKHTQNEKEKFKKEWKRITWVYSEDLAREYLHMMKENNNPVFLSEMMLNKTKARDVLDKMIMLQRGIGIRIFKFKAKHFRSDAVVFLLGQEEKVRNKIRYLYGRNSIRFPKYLFPN